MTEKEIHIQGMTCHHCVMAVKQELSKLPAVQVRDVTIGTAVVVFDEAKITPDQLNAAIEEAGYTPLA